MNPFSPPTGPDDGAAPRSLTRLLERCVERDASDLHLSPGLRPTFRIHGELVTDADEAPLSADEAQGIGEALMHLSGRAQFDREGAQDGALTSATGGRFRFNVFKTIRGVGVALRRLEDRFWSLAELGLPESLYGLCDLPDGLVVVAGPTGSGKSTTLGTLIDRINRTRACHVITIEDPIEYVHAPAKGIVNQRQVGAHAADFHGALVASLREDPDVILLGEVRDLDTIRTAIRAAETGHLVFTTVHASDTVGAIERMTSVFPSDEQAGIRAQLSLVLHTVVAQRLLPADPETATGHAMDRHRAVASEILVNTSGVANLIASGRSTQLYAMLETGRRYGMQTFEHDLDRLLTARRITRLTATTQARSPELLGDRAERSFRKTDGGEKR